MLATYAASELRPRSGLTMASTFTPADTRRSVTRAQLPASANAPCTRTTVGAVAEVASLMVLSFGWCRDGWCCGAVAVGRTGPFSRWTGQECARGAPPLRSRTCGAVRLVLSVLSGILVKSPIRDDMYD